MYDLTYKGLLMSSLVKKTIKGKQYYYIVDSKRVDGKPKIVNQIYIGPVESSLAH